MLSPDQIDLLRASFREVAKTRMAMVGLFYDRLFEIAPQTRDLFPAQMEDQGAKMMSTLGVIVAQLHSFDTLAPMVSDLARRHVRYGVVASDYDVVGEALLWALNKTLNDRFSPDIEAAWREAYAALSSQMVASAHHDNGNGGL